jgi:hypothetical protein
MGSDPEPVHTAWDRNAEGAVIEANSDAVKLAVGHGLELEWGMRRIVTQQVVVAASERLNLRWQCLKALLKPLGRGVLQGSRREPLR